jgi:hypothetical protein
LALVLGLVESSSSSCANGVGCPPTRAPRGARGPNGAPGATGAPGSTGANGATGNPGGGDQVQTAFFDTPQSLSWSDASGRVQLYSLTVPVSRTRLATVDATIAGAFDFLDEDTFNTYLLFINDAIVGRAGYEAEIADNAPRLETSKLIWGGTVTPPYFTINVTAELPNTPVAQCTVQFNATGNPFGSAAGAFLRYLLL